MPCNVCAECGAEYWSEQSHDGLRCADCDKADQDASQRAYAVDLPETSRQYSRSAMQARLGVTGETDD